MYYLWLELTIIGLVMSMLILGFKWIVAQDLVVEMAREGDFEASERFEQRGQRYKRAIQELGLILTLMVLVYTVLAFW